MTDKCPICKQYLWEWERHKCPPSWECIIKDYHDEEEPITFYTNAITEEGVAEHFVGSRFDGEGREWEVWVRKDLDAEWKKFNVTVEAVPSFTATPV